MFVRISMLLETNADLQVVKPQENLLAEWCHTAAASALPLHQKQQPCNHFDHILCVVEMYYADKGHAQCEYCDGTIDCV